MFVVMRKPATSLALALLLAFSSAPAAAQKPKHAKHPAAGAVLWQDPGDIRSRDLYDGPGGKEGQPHGPMKFLKEDLHGHNPKFDVEDARGKKWRVKMGTEAQPEVAASRLLWAIGYFANQNYFLPELEVRDLPTLSRGQNFVQSGGLIRNVRLQRHPGGEKRSGDWNWRHNPFVGTREFNGLRVMMALLSNWDLKDDNNAIFAGDSSPPREEYLVSDVGSTFGPSGRRYSDDSSRNDARAYSKTKFIAKVTEHHVDFNFPRRPPLLFLIFATPFYLHQSNMRWVGNHVPRSDAKWVGSLLAQLSHQQIRDAFRAAGYSPEQVERLAEALEHRIAELQQL